MSVREFVLASVLLLIPVSPAMAEEDMDVLEVLVVEMATTAEHHAAIANYYADKAEAARTEARRHRHMARAYGAAKIRDRERMKEHCEKIASSQEAVAEHHGKLAALHHELAGATHQRTHDESH